MRWGRKQAKQQRQRQRRRRREGKVNSSSSFSISNLLPLSWFSKLKNLSSKPKPPPTNPKRSPGPVSFPPPPPSPRQPSDSDHLSFSPAVLDQLIARFPASFHDAPRRRSIGDDDTPLARDGKTHRGGIARSARHNSVGQLEFRPPPWFSDPRSELRVAEFGHLIPFSRRSSRRLSRNLETASESERSESDAARVRRRRRRRRRIGRRKAGRELDGASDETTGLSALRTKPPLASDPDRTSQNRGVGEARRSFSGRIRPKVRVCSPRPSVASRAEMGRIKAATARRRVEAEEKRGLESFAVVKCSCDPQKDFRESMVEMIWEKGIGRPEELESLLACYLSLNSDEHHDVIVKVFRQVWFDLNPERFSSHRFDG